MRNLILAFICISFFPFISNAQQYSRPNRVFGNKQADIKMGVGLLPTYIADGAKTVFLPVTVGAEYFVADNISLGANMGYTACESKPEINNEELTQPLTNNTIHFDARIAFHCTRVRDFDFYGGFALGYEWVRVKAESEALQEELAYHHGIHERTGNMLYTGFVGMRYAPSKKYTLFSELGYGISILKVGVGYRIK